ncbi:ArsR/SmtB family transcription factor [Brachybacterium sacelli]|uniref:DNA-binding transcriptional ArsR family regulator n=1 Tax=Brachybacterium sacelli TaxID=173364 RepID=A0ABS4WW67_9MICO|nr:metalloregulator ArsR/SmtB family transcription factor [Brachybacterium sacelli]MBP2380455.1 DNA-binding transcriptional ArsR family regulator [Brachybacterium sacelli]
MTGRSPAEVLLGQGADATFAALADRTRRQILVRLADRPDDAGAIARDLQVSRQAVAKHLRVLEDAGIVHAARESRRRVHRVDAARVLEISDLLGVVARGWDRRLAGVAAEAQRRERSPERPTSDRLLSGGDDAAS